MTAPAKVELMYGLTRERLDLIKNTCAKGATDDEFALLCYQAQRTGLDPLSKQIYLIPHWDANAGKMIRTPQVSIDGLRVVADRSGKYAGQTAPQWADANGKWHDAWLADGPPAAAKVGVLRKDFELAVIAVARFESYVQTTKDGKPNRAWSEMPDIMIAKCAEALALRKAFPQDMSGLYTDDEHPATEAKTEDITWQESKPPPAHRAPESGPQMTRPNAIALCADVIKAVKAAKTTEAKQTAQDERALELQRIKIDFPDVYHRMVDRIKEDANESGI